MAFYLNRFKGMETREFEVEVITPLFLGGADSRKAELRAPSIKGALRFWWRALYGSDDLKEMKARESEIFGSTDKKSGFNVKVSGIKKVQPVLADLPRGPKVLTKSKGRTFPISIIEYLSYGLYKWDPSKRKNVYKREHFPSGTTFKLILRTVNKSSSHEILNSLYALANYGGLGSCSRNGFGSLRIPGLSGSFKFDGKLKSFTSVSSNAVLFDGFKPKNIWEDALAEIGKAYREARGSLEMKHNFKKRPLIAKPLIVRREVSITDRHSKPYFLHVTKNEQGKYRGHILFLPYEYHDTAKQKAYLDTCQEMNARLKALSGGTK